MRKTHMVEGKSDICVAADASQYQLVRGGGGAISPRTTRSAQGPAYQSLRRSFDVLVVALATPAVSILIGICGLLILSLMGRPVFFVQNRVGRDGRRFRMYKLRTMSVQPNACADSTAKNDPRVTPLGKILRQSHLDELPQLWNILKGEMTLIGPRPEQPELVEKYKELIPNYDLRHQVTPGLTGYAQVYYGYAATVDETRIKLEHDLYYVQNQCLKLDIKILSRTIIVYSNPDYVR